MFIMHDFYRTEVCYPFKVVVDTERCNIYYVPVPKNAMAHYVLVALLLHLTYLVGNVAHQLCEFKKIKCDN